jgi:2'-5' RNA ligase
LADTALVVLLPELEPLLGPWRSRLTGDGARGMPPHVTLIIPFADSSEVEQRLEAVRCVLASFSPFELALLETGRWPELLYLRPEPAEPFVAITEALVEAFPEFPSYAGEFDEIVPHVTVAQAGDEVLATVERELAAQLPVKTRVERAWLVEDTPQGWRRHTAFALERRTSV